MRRREFIGLFGFATAAWTFAARAQQGEQVRRIAVMMNLAENDPQTRARRDAFLLGLQELGWSQGRNLQIDYRWGVGDPDKHRKNAMELVALAPDVILAHGSTIMGPLLRATRKVPIVFVSVSDPIAGGFVASLSRPGGNATGFTSFEYGQSGKWLELLKQITPDLTRVAIVRDPEQVSGAGQVGAIQAVASSLRVDLIPIDVRDIDEFDRTLATFASRPSGGLIVTTAAIAQVHRDRIIAAANRLRLPAIYPYRLFTAAGGLMAYGPDISDQYRRAAGYVARILKGEEPTDLPVQAPVKYELVINVKTAKVLKIDVPPTLLARADQVIE